MNKPYDRPMRGRQCQCQACFEYFNSDYGFDRHRVGDWQRRGANRRCLTVDEMTAAGWEKNAAGLWIEETRSKRRERGGVTDPSGARPINQ